MDRIELAKGLFAQRDKNGSVRIWLEDESTVDATLTAKEFADKIGELVVTKKGK